MLLRLVVRVIQVFVRFDVFVDVIHFDLKQKSVGVCVQELAHCPSLKVVCVKIHDEFFWLAGVVFWY